MIVLYGPLKKKKKKKKKKKPLLRVLHYGKTIFKQTSTGFDLDHYYSWYKSHRLLALSPQIRTSTVHNSFSLAKYPRFFEISVRQTLSLPVFHPPTQSHWSVKRSS